MIHSGEYFSNFAVDKDMENKLTWRKTVKLKLACNLKSQFNVNKFQILEIFLLPYKRIFSVKTNSQYILDLST